VIVTEETAWASGFIGGMTVVTIMSVVCGHVLSGGSDEQHVQQASYAFAPG
jgi:hypothetical protein